MWWTTSWIIQLPIITSIFQVVSELFSDKARLLSINTFSVF